jgi:hypothetical protein
LTQGRAMVSGFVWPCTLGLRFELCLGARTQPIEL